MFHNISVIVVHACRENSAAGYIKAFESFAKDNFDVEFDIKPKTGCKCILLCNVVTRVPEDVQWLLQNLGLNGKIIKFSIALQYFVNKRFTK